MNHLRNLWWRLSGGEARHIQQIARLATHGYSLHDFHGLMVALPPPPPVLT